MTTAVQVQYRRGTSSQVTAFTGAQGEMVIDTTNNRVVVQDGATAGGWPAAKLAEVVTNTRTAVSDAAYSALTTDRMVAYTALTAARIVSLPAAASFPAGTRLLVVDESGNCSSTDTITLSANGSDSIHNGGTSGSSYVINTACGYVAIESNSSSQWTVVDQTPSPGGVTSVNTLTGGLTIAATDGLAVSSSGTSITLGGPGGMVNKFRNATMDVWQRGTSPPLSAGTSGSGYTADGWIVGFTASSSAAPTIAQAGGRQLTKNALQVTGASNITDVYVKQRIESLIAAAFCSQIVTVQAQVYNGTGGSITPKLTVNRPSAQDNYTSSTADVNAVSLQSCGNAAWTRVSYSFTANAASYNGLEVLFDFGNNFSTTGKSIQLTELDIRVTPSAAAGATNFSPPPPELRPVITELEICQRYFWKSFPQGTAPASGAGLTGAINYIVQQGGATYYYSVAVSFPTTMRSAPTITFYNPINSGSNWYDNNASANSGTSAAAGASDRGFNAVNNPQVSGDSVNYSIYIHAAGTAEL